MLQLRTQPVQIELPLGGARFFSALRDDPDARLKWLGTPAWDRETLHQAAALVRHPCRAIPDLETQNPVSHPAVGEVLGLVRSGGVVFVVTGQQAGLFTGPLYTIYKALTVVCLVRELRQANIPAVGLFWIASEDHDFQEVATATLALPTKGTTRFALEPPPDVPWPVGQIPLGSSIKSILDELNRGLPQTSNSLWLNRLVGETHTPATTFSSAFQGLMKGLFAPSGLLFFDPLLAKRKDWTEFFDVFAKQRPAAVQHLTAVDAELTAVGYPPQVHFQPERSFLFYLHPEAGRRRVVVPRPGHFQVEGTPLGWDEADWPAVIAEHAQWLSPDALLRPLLQDFLFPTAVYVGGPAEIAYHAQIRGLYPLWKIEPPLLWPRWSATVVPPGAARRLDKLGLNPAEVFQGRDALIQLALARQGRTGALELFQERRMAAERCLTDLQTMFADYPDDFRRSAVGTLGKVDGLLSKLEEHLQRHIKSQNDDITQRVETIQAELFPGMNLQERSLNLIPWLNQYGQQLLERLAVAVDPFCRDHQLIFLEDA